MFKRLSLWVVGIALTIGAAASAQQSRWASPSDETAKSMIEMERRWAEADCDGNLSAETTLAGDFLGTAPDNKRYTKAEEIQETKTKKHESRGCQLGEAKVRFFGDNLALIYGSESRIQKKDGKERTETLVWTDTWLKRDGRWQIIAAQDNWGQAK